MRSQRLIQVKEYEEKEAESSLERVTGTIFILVLFVFLLINIIVPDKESQCRRTECLHLLRNGTGEM